jgi:site-specific recombinase XerD
MAYLAASAPDVLLNEYIYEKLPVSLSRRHRPIGLFNRYGRYLARTRNRQLSTVLETFKTLTNFASFLERQDIEAVTAPEPGLSRTYRRACRDVEILLTDVSDDVLERFRNGDDNMGVSHRTINRKLGRVLHFFVWAQKYNLLPKIIGDPATGEDYPIKIWWETRPKSRKKVLCSELLYRGKSLSSRQSGIPTDAEMAEAYAAVSHSALGIAARDVLLLKLAEDLALRGAECINLRCEDLPTREEFGADEVQEEGWTITVKRKGGKLQDLVFGSEIVGELMDYVEAARSEVMRNNPTIPEHGFIFVSHQTGKRLNRQYISRRLSEAFGASKALRRGQKKKLSHQRVRAKSLNDLIRTLVDRDVEMFGNLRNIREEHILTIAAAFAGHDNPESLRHYLDLEIAGRIKKPTKDEGAKGALRGGL